MYARRSEKPQQTYPGYKSVRYECFIKGVKEGNGAYEGMVVMVAFLSQEGVEGASVGGHVREWKLVLFE